MVKDEVAFGRVKSAMYGTTTRYAALIVRQQRRSETPTIKALRSIESLCSSLLKGEEKINETL